MSEIETKTDPEVTERPEVTEVAAAPATTGAPSRSTKPQVGVLGAFVNFLGSYLFTIIILLCLMVLTYFGTVAQMSIGLVKATHIYFDSFLCRLDLEPLGLPIHIRFPGAFLLLILLSVNLITGGLVRIRWRRRNTGIIIVHFGMLFLMISGLVKFTTATNGAMRLWPNETGSTYESFHEWELVIGEQRGDGKVREHIVPQSDLADLGSFHSEAVPFRLVVDQFFENSRAAKAKTSLGTDVVDGIYLDEREWVDESKDVNIAGAYVTVHVDGEKPKRGILWGFQEHPWTVTVDGMPWTIDLRKRVFDLPFEVRLEKFTKKEHPGITLPSHFSSDVTKVEGGVEQKFHISMNNPMRHGGFMFSQNNWGPQDGRPGPYYSVLEVSSNPSDQWPKYACYVIAFGLLLHFVLKLWKHIQKQNQLRLEEQEIVA